MSKKNIGPPTLLASWFKVLQKPAGGGRERGIPRFVHLWKIRSSSKHFFPKTVTNRPKTFFGSKRFGGGKKKDLCKSLFVTKLWREEKTWKLFPKLVSSHVMNQKGERKREICFFLSSLLPHTTYACRSSANLYHVVQTLLFHPSNNPTNTRHVL